MTDAADQALRVWIRQFGPHLMGVCQSFAAGPEEAEDLLQETWLVALRKYRDVTSPEVMGAWLHAIALNIGRGHARRRARRRSLRERFKDDLPGGNGMVNPMGFSGHHVQGVLWRSVAELPELQRRVVLHRIVDGLTTEETAKVLGRAEGTVKASLHRGLEKLRRRLREHPGFDQVRGL
jgi:RNA polymerase sigma-70 factor (ECF subfamily)